MATSFPDDCRYTNSHEYVRPDGPLVRIGITAFAVEQLGDIVFVELPEVGTTLQQGRLYGSVESVKAVEDLFAPISGTVVRRNEAIFTSPEELQNDPYHEGWLLQLRPADPGQLDTLLDADAYRALVATA